MRVNTRAGATKDAPYRGPSWWAIGGALLLALLFQVELSHYIVWRGASFSLVLILVVWYAMHADVRRAALFGLVAGALEDSQDTMTGGSWTIATTVTAVFANQLARRFFPDSILVICTVAFLATLLRRMIFWIMMALTMNYSPGYARVHFHQAVYSSIMNAIVMAIAMIISRRYAESPI